MSWTSSAVPGMPRDPDVDFGPGTKPGRPSRRPILPAQAVIVFAVGCGGALGAVGRYAVSLGLPTQDAQFPWGTFVINLTGSAVLGFLLILLIEQFPRGRLVRPFVGTGVCGGYTTFSTFSVEAVDLVRHGQPEIALLYVFGSVLGGLAAVWIGMTGARLAVRTERWLQEEMR